MQQKIEGPDGMELVEIPEPGPDGMEPETDPRETFVDLAEVSDDRRKSLRLALELGAELEVLEVLARARRLARTTTIVLPPHKLEGLSRGRGWARKGKGRHVEWGVREDDGYRVGPGRWTVGGHDGFSRKRETEWIVESITVGTQVWTVAS